MKQNIHTTINYTAPNFMSASTKTPYYVITQVINGIKNYYSHWERLHAESSVYGVIWQERLAYAYIFVSHQDVKKMARRIKDYDNRINILIEPVTIIDIKYSIALVKANGWPAPDFIVNDNGDIVEITHRETGEVLKDIEGRRIR